MASKGINKVFIMKRTWTMKIALFVDTKCPLYRGFGLQVKEFYGVIKVTKFPHAVNFTPNNHILYSPPVITL